MGAVPAETEAYISVARDRIVSVSVYPQFSVLESQYSSLPPTSLHARRPSRGAHTQWAAAYSFSSCSACLRNSSSMGSPLIPTLNALSRRSLRSEPESLPTAAAAAAQREAWGAQDSQPLEHEVSAFERSEFGDAVVRRLAARAPSQATRGHSPRVCAALAHTGAARLGGGGGRTAAATCAEVWAEL